MDGPAGGRTGTRAGDRIVFLTIAYSTLPTLGYYAFPVGLLVGYALVYVPWSAQLRIITVIYSITLYYYCVPGTNTWNMVLAVHSPVNCLTKTKLASELS